MGRYTNIQESTTLTGKRFKNTVKYPDIPLSFNDIYIYTDEGDRFDILAQTYYGNPQLWWIISIANPQLTQGSIIPPMGIQIRIPTNTAGIINLYNQLNDN